VIEPKDTSVVAGQTAALHCQADGFPLPSVIWRKGHGDYFLSWSFAHKVVMWLTGMDEQHMFHSRGVFWGLITNQLTALSRAIVEEPWVVQLLKDFPTSMETEDSVSCSHEPPIGPYAEPDEPSPYHLNPITPRSIIILSYHLFYGLPSSFFPSGFLTDVLYDCSSPCSFYMLFSFHVRWIHSSNYIWWIVHIMKLIMWFHPISCHFKPLNSSSAAYSHTHSV
jgi:hypothetical protein